MAGGKDADAHVGDDDKGTDLLDSDNDDHYDHDDDEDDRIDGQMSGEARKKKDKGILKTIKNEQIIVFPWKCPITHTNKITAIVNLPSGVQESDVEVKL